jgi:hypothetical protein
MSLSFCKNFIKDAFYKGHIIKDIWIEIIDITQIRISQKGTN